MSRIYILSGKVIPRIFIPDFITSETLIDKINLNEICSDNLDLKIETF